MKNDYDVVIVGCGLSGAVLAERFATVMNRKVVIFEKRDHIAGNCYDYVNEYGILMNKYGAHLFHTNDEDVWKYVQQFSEWIRWDHKVIGCIENVYVPIPVNITTVNTLCKENIMNEKEMDLWLATNQVPLDTFQNSEEVALARVGTKLYNTLFKQYTYKQWEKYPSELDPSVLARIPVRNNFDDRYFSDRYQALPKHGYTKFVEKILDHPNIQVVLNTDFMDIKEKISYKCLIFTGQIDQYYATLGYPKLEYRSISFEEETYPTYGYYQPNSVINYPGIEVPYTRIVEYKHFLHQKSAYTTIVKEITTNKGEPYYPVPTKENQELYQRYKEMADKEKDIHFIGRLANYKYFNMDAAIKNALDYFNTRMI